MLSITLLLPSWWKSVYTSNTNLSCLSLSLFYIKLYIIYVSNKYELIINVNWVHDRFGSLNYNNPRIAFVPAVCSRVSGIRDWLTLHKVLTIVYVRSKVFVDFFFLFFFQNDFFFYLSLKEDNWFSMKWQWLVFEITFAAVECLQLCWSALWISL